MSAFGAKLARLRQEAGERRPQTAAGGSAAPPPNLRPVHGMAPALPSARSASPSPYGSATIDTLRRLLGVRERMPTPTSPLRAIDRELPGVEIAPGVRLHEQRLCWPPPPQALDLAALGYEAACAPARLRFFDTETTGLAGGTGTRAFQLGLGDWHAGAFRVRQLTLTALAGEAAMLEAFATWFVPGDLLVSYNGRSYDAPLLATRYRLARLESPLPALPHLDLLHPTRRRYRGRWENCRLATIERELLRIVRDDDLPGSEAPRAWRDWLRGGSARDLRRVGLHNRQDLASLAQLLLRLAPGVESVGDAVSMPPRRSGNRGARP